MPYPFDLWTDQSDDQAHLFVKSGSSDLVHGMLIGGDSYHRVTLYYNFSKTSAS